MKTLYLDMDGVIADFNGYADKVLGRKTEGAIWPEADWHELQKNQRIYRDLEKTKEADDLVAFCKNFCAERNYNLMFLTAVPKANDVKWAFYDKVLWVQKHYPDLPVMFGPYSSNKHLHCTGDDILIDDRHSNIREWETAGGVAILYTGDLKRVFAELTKIS